MKRRLIMGMLLVAAVIAPFASAQPNITKASTLLDRYVVTDEGEELGKVEDIAIDQADGRVAYIVVSVASFLINDNLIAVHPDALLPLRNSANLVLHTEQDLQTVERFTQDRWPLEASVLPSDAEPRITAAPEDRSTSDEADDAPAPGTATITGSTRTATLSAGERRITAIRLPIATPTNQISTVPYDGPPTEFDRLDKDGNGSLNRREIAHQLSNEDRYADVDGDGNGVVDRFEFDVWIERQE